MYSYDKYFKILENYVGNKTRVRSISKLTRELAESGGYHKGPFLFNNGKIRERVLYDKPMDSYLTARWLLFYKTLFTQRLHNHPELDDYFIDIINKTFYMVMTSIDFDKSVCDSVVNKYVNLALSSRIADAMRNNKSKYSTKKYVRGEPAPFVLKGAIDNQAVSLDALTDENMFDISDDFVSDDIDIEAEILYRLRNNPIGKVVYDAMITSKNKFNIKKIDTEIGLPISMCTEENRKNIASAYNTIKESLLEFNSLDGRRMRKIGDKSFKYSFEKSGE